MKHPHAELMLQYAQDAMETDKPWERWEYLDISGEWMPFYYHRMDNQPSPAWQSNIQYRRKSKTIRVNGFDVPEPMMEKPTTNQRYFVPSIGDQEWFYSSKWEHYPTQVRCFERNLCHSTKNGAIKHGMALCGIDPSTYKGD